jgi:hypothetical protein
MTPRHAELARRLYWKAADQSFTKAIARPEFQLAHEDRAMFLALMGDATRLWTSWKKARQLTPDRFPPAPS